MTHPARWINDTAAKTPLRIKLVVTVLVLATAGLTVAGFAATTSLHSYLLNRVDDQLKTASGRGGGFEFGGGFGGSPSGGFTNAPPGAEGSTSGTTSRRQPPSAFYFALFTSAGVRVGAPTRQFGAYAATPKLPVMTPAFIATHHDKPFTVGSTKGSTSWRVVAMELPDGGGGVVVATSLSDIDHTVNHLILIEVLIGGIVLILMGGGGYLLIKRSLRPLAEVETTAAAIAGGDLSQRVPSWPPRTEVGRLATALNGMLTQIEGAFAHEHESQLAARASEDRMRRFVADASHELRTPLTSIRGFAELHRMGAATEASDVRRLMQRVEDEASRMGLLVEDLLLLARLDQQRPLERKAVDLLDIATDVVHDARVVAPNRSIDLQVHTSTPPIVTGDEPRLRQVVHNLMTNAIAHTPDGTPITLGLATYDDDRPRAVIEVSDTGPGLTDEQAQRVFERFYRGDTSRSRAAGGTGLGLSIVAGIVAAHGGRVTVESQPRDGATFRVELPLTAADPTPEAAPELAPDVDTSSQPLEQPTT